MVDGINYGPSPTTLWYPTPGASPNSNPPTWANVLGKPIVTVSPYGISIGSPGVTQPNNGADFGPDTNGTKTYGINEAISSIANDTGPVSTGGGGIVQLGGGAYKPSVPIVVYPGVTLQGAKRFPRSVVPSAYTLTGVPSIQPTGTGDTIQTTQYPEGGTDNVTNVSITVMGLEVYGTGSSGSSAVHLSNTDHCAVVGCDVKSCYNGITFDVISPSGAGEGGYSSIEDNSVATYSNYGIYNFFNTQMRIINNQFDAPNPGALAAIISERSNTAVISGNVIQGVIETNMIGIWLDEVVSDPTSNTIVSGNVVVGGSGTGTVGIEISGASETLITIEGNHINAVTTPISYPAGLTKTRITGNNGFNPQAFAITTPAVPASGTELVNPFPFPVSLYALTAGTVSAVKITDVFGNPQTFSGALNVGKLYDLGPQDGITLTYSAAPTWAWYGT